MCTHIEKWSHCEGSTINGVPWRILKASTAKYMSSIANIERNSNLVHSVKQTRRLPDTYKNMSVSCSVERHIKMVYDLLYVPVIRGRRRCTSTSADNTTDIMQGQLTVRNVCNKWCKFLLNSPPALF